ncbi:hypothetical protein BBP40_008804 [Aspergillus hancockii]|nr:hypothetical protein BBP40_008804 [Aspergillus hancockii]
MSHLTTSPPKQPRRFLPEPIETTTRSSKAPQSIPHRENTLSRGQKDLHTAVVGKENTNYSLAKLASPIEHQLHKNPASSTVAETNSCPPGSLQGDSCSLGRLSVRQRVSQSSGLLRTSHARDKQDEPISNTDDLPQLRPRKFVPQLMETASRSFRRGSSPYASSHGLSRQELESENLGHFSGVRDTPVDAGSHLAYESPFSYSRLQQRQETRRHSFRVPDLPAIPSSGSEGSEGSDLPSLPVSPSISSRQSVIPPKVEEDRRESCDEHFSSFLLSLAARSAEKQLKEQALAAFPNEQVYQPVDHFAIDREEEDCPSQDEPMIREGDEVLIKWRRASSADLSWELEHLRQHKEEAEMRDRAMAGTQGMHISPLATSTYLTCGKNHKYTNSNGGRERDCESVQPRPLRSPPMLGDDLIFPQSVSPETTFCESSNSIECDIQNYPGLWHATARPDDHFGGDGLWMGTCKHTRKSQDPLYQSTKASNHHVKRKTWLWPDGVLIYEDQDPTKPRDKIQMSDERGRNRSGVDTDNEFHDGFVTQIYNYLSLGYPSVARYYDYELSKVSGIPVADLRQDDMNTGAKGYVSLADNNLTDGATRNVCMRWLALRSYIHEWAMQQPITVQDDSNHGTWGVRERRGSWAG